MFHGSLGTEMMKIGAYIFQIAVVIERALIEGFFLLAS